MIENLLYTALATLLVIVILHVGVFWVSRVIQPPKPRVVYMQSPVQQLLPQQSPPQFAPVVQQQQPPQFAPAAALQAPLQAALQAPLQAIPEVKLPTYDSPAPPPSAKPATPAMPTLPPPIETRDASRSPPPQA